MSLVEVQVTLSTTKVKHPHAAPPQSTRGADSLAFWRSFCLQRWVGLVRIEGRRSHCLQRWVGLVRIEGRRSHCLLEAAFRRWVELEASRGRESFLFDDGARPNLQETRSHRGL